MTFSFGRFFEDMEREWKMEKKERKYTQNSVIMSGVSFFVAVAWRIHKKGVINV